PPAAGPVAAEPSFAVALARLLDNPVVNLFLAVVEGLMGRDEAPTSAFRTAPAQCAVIDAIVAGDRGLAQHRVRRELATPSESANG
uniref:hypothetical protein n=1 Tax=Pseudonocardia pini TaxID=2758030 RepID=UPI0035E44DCC